MMAATHNPIAPPSRLLLLAEARALWEAGAAVALWPLLQLTPRGDGHPVLVLPGLVASDMSTKLLRRFLQSRGYDAHGWGLGRNLGPREGIEDGMVEKLEALHAEERPQGQPGRLEPGRRLCAPAGVDAGPNSCAAWSRWAAPSPAARAPPMPGASTKA